MENKWHNAGTKLRELRKTLKPKMSVFKVAKQIHISGNYMSLIERGLNCPNDQILFNLAEFYGVDPGDLFKLYDKMIPPTLEQMNAIPSLRKIMTEISIDEKLSSDEKEAFAKRVYEIATQFINKED
ncbi:helix-turn-helix domain-containing protein [Clostridium saccharoperbutylacetonicum]|uniref:helix-turn-helix domain-containing protein n=1 Tax=Clostridium saccharoperbutylacetonicum TaxID=36745 RepID=UPI000983D3ED|nr:helix-turn-helix transcriptional regulator [Clostridium saccharoperbutylacetonicum]AQR98143.1 helix-turn-helix domain protein [Clostridium saccharoperbutylacetonicum]NSB34036.1 transcriptional regulator with XRE-family HTH domain [Clostridium saccharoperbutylacetonicum]